MKAATVVLLVLPLIAVVPTANAQDAALLLTETRNTALPVLPKIVQAMQAAVKEQGPVGAIAICQQKAPQLLREMRQQTGWEIRRVSLKTRNAATGTPDVWEARQLAEFNIRLANGAKPEPMEIGEVVADADGKRSYRYMKALPVTGVCLSCHGPAETLSDDLKAALAKDYPLDRATGYSIGEVRGGLSVRRPL